MPGMCLNWNRNLSADCPAWTDFKIPAKFGKRKVWTLQASPPQAVHRTTWEQEGNKPCVMFMLWTHTTKAAQIQKTRKSRRTLLPKVLQADINFTMEVFSGQDDSKLSLRCSYHLSFFPSCLWPYTDILPFPQSFQWYGDTICLISLLWPFERNRQHRRSWVVVE